MAQTIDQPLSGPTAHQTDAVPTSAGEDMVSLASQIPKRYRNISTHDTFDPKYLGSQTKSLSFHSSHTRAQLKKKFLMQRTISQPNASTIDYTKMQMNSSILSQNTTARNNANFKQIIDRIKQITDDNDQLLDKIESQDEYLLYEEDQKQAYMRRIT